MNIQFSSWLNADFIPQKLTTVAVTLIATVYFLVIFNQPVIALIAGAHGLNNFNDYIFMASAIIFLMLLINFIISLLAFKYIFKPWLIFLLIGAALSSYYMQTYNILINREMIQNVIETDYQEAAGLFSWKMVLQIILFGSMPGIIVTQLRIEYHSAIRELAHKLAISFISLLSVGLIALLFYQDYASLFRNNRHLRDQILPLNYVYAGYSYASTALTLPAGKIKSIGTDAQLNSAWVQSTKKVVSIIVVGETARAANFSLNGYTRETNPELKKQDIVYFSNFHSCGTATATSVPCMFSNFGRNNYDGIKAKGTENLLDVIQHAGLSVLWRDNNSGCKGVCDRVNYDDVSHLTTATLCKAEECFDPILLDQLKEKIDLYTTGDKKGIVIVLHQHGSHGPAYFERTPVDFQRYKPLCHTNQLQECTQPEIINAYDNTIAYTDYTISRIIDFLKAHENDYDSSLIYLSDHGESLGENNLYLHGLPYSIAPSEQTHIPALFWMSEDFSKRFNINKQCLHKHASDEYSHDFLFHSVLGLLNINTAAYNPELDLFNSCRTNIQEI